MYKIFCAVVFWSFIAIKAFGATYAAWSWWWVLLPIVPPLGVLIQYYKL